MPSFPRYHSVPLSEDEELNSHNQEETNAFCVEPHTNSGASGTSTTVSLGEPIPPPKPDLYAPPPYSECTSEIVLSGDEQGSLLVEPPSYEEVQLLKAQEAAAHESAGDLLLPPYATSPNSENGTRSNGVQVVRISSLGGLDPQSAEIAEEQLLGTDVMFFVAFSVAFIFNWLGFILLLCFCHTVAGRTGALAGFGLSLAKWAVIVRHSTDLVGDSNSWLLWVIMVLGLLVCMRAILQYLHAKREWQHVPNSSRHRFFLFY